MLQGEPPTPTPDPQPSPLDDAIAGILAEIEREPVPEQLLELAIRLQAALRARRASPP